MQTSALACEWIPARTTSSKLMIVMHGRGDSPAGFRWMPEVLGLPDLNFLLLRAPEPYYTGFSWYDLPPNQGPGIAQSRKLLDDALDEILAAGYRSEDIIIFGFSQGCLMTLEWAGRVPHTFAACIGVSGYCYDPESLAREFSPEARRSRWLITHGTFDDVLDFKVTEAQIRYLTEQGLPLEFKRYRKAHTIDEREELPMLREFIRGALK